MKETPATFLAPPEKLDLAAPLRGGLLVILLFFGLFGLWAAWAPLEKGAMALGTVIVDSKRKTLQHLEGGIVREILVRDGQQVKAGEVLVRLDDTQTRVNLDLLQSRRRSATALEARLTAERDALEAVTFPPWLLAERDNPEVAKILDGQVNIFNARRRFVAGQTSILQRKMAQYDEEIIGIRGQIEAENQQYALIQEEIESVQNLYDKGLEKKPRLLALKRRASEIEGSRRQNRALIARAEQNIAESHLHITELSTKMVNEAVRELKDVQGELMDLSERMRAAEDILERTRIRASRDGTIVGLRIHTSGGIIGPGEPLMEIVPSKDRLIIEAQVDPFDIDVVHPGLPTQIRLSALKQRNLAPLEGEVVSVSADLLSNEQISYYLARIEVTRNPDGITLYPGMSAEVMIVTGKRTFLEYLLQPLSETLERAFREE